MNKELTPTEVFIKILSFFSNGARYFTPEMKLTDLENEQFDEWAFLQSILALQIHLDADIPGEYIDLAKLSGTTVGEFVEGARRLPRTNDDLFPSRIIRMIGDNYEMFMNNACENADEPNQDQ